MDSFGINVLGNVIAAVIMIIATAIFMRAKKLQINTKIILFVLSLLFILFPVSSFIIVLAGGIEKLSPLIITIELISLSAGLILFIILIVKYVDLKKNGETLSNWEKEYEDFEKTANEKLHNKELAKALCAIRKAFNKIESETNSNFDRGQCINEHMKMPHRFKGQQPDKETTNLEVDLYNVYKECLEETYYKDNLFTDIHVRPEMLDEGIKYRWVLDTLDGGLHFTRNIPLFTSSIALQTRENKSDEWVTQIGATYIPLTREIFFAVRGEGAYLNNWNVKLPLAIKEKKSSADDAIFYIEFPNKRQKEKDNGLYDECMKFLEKLFPKVKKIRGFNLGSFGLAYLAKGSFDAYISLTGTTSLYDSVAGRLLVSEANGKFISDNLDDLNSASRIFASSKEIYKSLVSGDDEFRELLNTIFIDIDKKMNYS